MCAYLSTNNKASTVIMIFSNNFDVLKYLNNKSFVILLMFLKIYLGFVILIPTYEKYKTNG